MPYVKIITGKESKNQTNGELHHSQLTQQFTNIVNHLHDQGSKKHIFQRRQMISELCYKHFLPSQVQQILISILPLRTFCILIKLNSQPSHSLRILKVFYFKDINILI